ncbi:hypothetical protein L484_027215 [Morus notabilis]|uniref:Plastid movement impaired protein n=1 Tax=Morus notabilis TaxID=981085 RepID=W9S984_9ROSA|nr:uncharacterized protein At1g66480 [Morus notabilis]EXC20656.1 hypothetical protein L484_027215 [Morus notabilis]
MGNSITGGGKKRVKIMKINGETFKVKIPIRALDVTKDHQGHVLLDSEAVKHFGIKANPLEPQQHLKPNKVYFLVEIPRFPTSENNQDEISRGARRVRSGINMSAKDRLECLMLSRRSVSDMSLLRPSSSTGLSSGGPGPVRVKMRLPLAQVEKLVEESRDKVEVAEKILALYMGDDGGAHVAAAKDGGLIRREEWKPGRASITKNHEARQKRVSFLPIEEGEIRLALAAS